MKIRQGFVSNSSSSSFIVVGVKIKRDDPICKNYWENDKLPEEFKDLELVGELYGHEFSGYDLIGDQIADFDNSEDSGAIDLNLIQEITNKFPEEYRKDVKVYYGTRGC